MDCAILILLFICRCLEDWVKSQKSPQVEEGEEAMGKGKEAKHEGNAMMLQRLIIYQFHLLSYIRKMCLAENVCT